MADDKETLARNILSGHDRKERSKDEGEFGTSKSGYVPARCGPFRCDNCISYPKRDRCDYEAVVSDPKVKKGGDLAIVDAGGCCRFFWPSDCDKASRV